jgi:hypothetical protein
VFDTQKKSKLDMLKSSGGGIIGGSAMAPKPGEQQATQMQVPQPQQPPQQPQGQPQGQPQDSEVLNNLMAKMQGG